MNCKICDKKISRYNDTGKCWCHTITEETDKTPPLWVIVKHMNYSSEKGIVRGNIQYYGKYSD